MALVYQSGCSWWERHEPTRTFAASAGCMSRPPAGMGAVLQSKESDPKLASAMLVISEPGDDLVIIDEVSTGQERCRNSAPRLRPGASARGSQPYRPANHHPACSEIVAKQERCPWWVSRPKGLLRCGPAMTPPISVNSLVGSSPELPTGSFRADPAVRGHNPLEGIRNAVPH
jgi:hypothetical protein